MSPSAAIRLGVNLDHVATIRQARGTTYPDLMEAVRTAEAHGADGITMHLREDRRHIQDHDMYDARRVVTTTLNMEMAATEEMIYTAEAVGPDFCCLVPERREELTTEGGLDVIGQRSRLADAVARLTAAGIRVSLFVEPDPRVLEVSAEIGAPMVELHTGAYANLSGGAAEAELTRIRDAARIAAELGLQVNAGHGLHYENVGPIAAIPQIAELNIGHAIVARAIFVGLGRAVREMKDRMRAAREAA
ncbi:MAG TPA: pyridoxine 5'-phosphate synthase [Chromatiales bacterium]|nr:pyridoxine 5'-phosphate synthase [Chromatiales bacterium]